VIGNHGDRRRLAEGEFLGLHEEVLMDVASRTEASPHRQLRAVVFNDIGNAEVPAEPRAGEIAEAHPLIQEGRPQSHESGAKRLVVERVGAEQIALAGILERRPDHLLGQPEFVEQRVMARHEADEAARKPRQFAGDIAGVAVAAARNELGPVIGPEIDADALDRRFRRRRRGRRERRRREIRAQSRERAPERLDRIGIALGRLRGARWRPAQALQVHADPQQRRFAALHVPAQFFEPGAQGAEIVDRPEELCARPLGAAVRLA
jgi:hypothetical protein